MKKKITIICLCLVTVLVCFVAYLQKNQNDELEYSIIKDNTKLVNWKKEKDKSPGLYLASSKNKTDYIIYYNKLVNQNDYCFFSFKVEYKNRNLNVFINKNLASNDEYVDTTLLGEVSVNSKPEKVNIYVDDVLTRFRSENLEIFP
ncbi:hypothetical protein [Anaerosacchariphilus polymeriproducens]|nr:hypothetical protein [Anaerosacchariphilus polymeriproducens]